MKNFDYLNKKQFKGQQVQFSALIGYFNQHDQQQEYEFIVTKDYIILQNNDKIKYIKIKCLEGFVYSKTSSEFLIVLKFHQDLRLCSTQYKQCIAQILLKIVTKYKKYLEFYFLEDFNLQKYMTDADGISQCRKSRGLKPEFLILDQTGFKNFQTKFQALKNEIKKQTSLIYPIQNNKVSMADFELIKVLGEGAYGKVFLAQHLKTLKQYAIKVIKKEKIINQQKLEHIKAEKQILEKANHPFLVQLKYCFQTASKVYFVMEYMEGNDLFTHLQSIQFFTEEQIQFIAACIIQAIGHLHNKDYIYRDLKPENILFNKDGIVKLTDFGLVKKLRKQDLAETFCGTAEYMAPEMILKKGANRSSDWWSLGILLYEMCYGFPPFYSSDTQLMYQKTLSSDLQFPDEPKVSSKFKNFLKSLLIKDHSVRLGSKADSFELMCDPWLQNFNIFKLLANKIDPPYKPMKFLQQINKKNSFILTNLNKPKDSACWIDPLLIQQYQKEFEYFDQNQDSFNSSAQNSVSNYQISKLGESQKYKKKNKLDILEPKRTLLLQLYETKKLQKRSLDGQQKKPNFNSLSLKNSNSLFKQKSLEHSEGNNVSKEAELIQANKLYKNTNQSFMQVSEEPEMLNFNIKIIQKDFERIDELVEEENQKGTGFFLPSSTENSFS